MTTSWNRTRLQPRPAAVRIAIIIALSLMALALADARADVIFSNFDSNTAWTAGIGVANGQPAAEYEQAMRYVPTVDFTLDALVLPMFTPAQFGIYFPQPPAGTVFGDSVSVAVYADNAGQPGALLEQVAAPDIVPFWGGTGPFPAAVTVTFSGRTQLHSGQAYWVGLIETEATAVYWMYADVMAESVRRLRVAGGPTWGSPSPYTRAGLEVHGTPIGSCWGDIDDSGAVNISDLLEVVNNWGTCAGCPPVHCAADIAPPHTPPGDCAIDLNDLLMVINNWGPCP